MVKNERKDCMIAKLANLLVVPIWLAIGIGIMESFILWQSGKQEFIQHPVGLMIATLPFLYAILWLPFLALLRILVTREIVKRIRLVALFVRVTVVIVIFIAMLITLSSWFFFRRTGMFLAPNHLYFALENISAIQLHFLQTGLLLWLGATFTCLVMAIVLVQCLSHWLPPPLGIHSWITMPILAIMFAALPIQWIWASLQPDRQPAHPLISFFSLAQRNDSLTADDAITMPDLRPKSGRYEPDLEPNKVFDKPVIIFMIDSMRWDLVSHEPSPIPFMKSLINQSIFFDKAYAPASHSNYADLSFWYSQFPFKGTKSGKYGLSDPWRGTSIFEVFHKLGYKTAYISSQNEKWGSMRNWLKIPEVDYYFDSENHEGKTWVNEFDEAGLVGLIRRKIATAGKVEDSATLKVGESWISEQPNLSRIFVGFNLQNTHFNYIIPNGGKEPFQPGKLDFPAIYAAWPKDRVPVVRNRFFNALINVDSLIHEFVDFLKEKGIWDNCYFIILGDSGEAFFEHGVANHSGPMYDEQMRTFCLIKAPREMHVLSRVSEPISHIDILPGLLDLMGIPVPDSFQGLSPFSCHQRKHVYMYSKALVDQGGILRWPWKLLITTWPKRKFELYNLEIDPEEIINVFWKNAKISGELYSELRRWLSIQSVFYSKLELYEHFELPPKNWTGGEGALMPTLMAKEVWYNARHETSA